MGPDPCPFSEMPKSAILKTAYNNGAGVQMFLGQAGYQATFKNQYGHMLPASQLTTAPQNSYSCLLNRTIFIKITSPQKGTS